VITKDEQIYHSDASLDGPKFTLFSLAALELARHLDWVPDILHANDWHTALSIYALRQRRHEDRFFNKTITLIGVHNMPYLGVGAGNALASFGLSPAYGSMLPWWAQDMPLPLGLLSADHIVTVSPSYAQEMLTPDFASGLHDFLQSRSQNITGILNGLDTLRWDPATDSALTANYSLDSLDARRANKTALQNELGLTIDPSIPLLCMVTRLDPQKGVDLLPNALRQAADFTWQVVILGTGDPALEGTMRTLEASFPNRIRAAIRFDTRLSRRIYSAADAILIPSRYEPCGLTQMIGMRYGCIPIAHATGGLRDTVLDYTDFDQSTGFLFHGLTSESLAAVIRRTLHVYAQPELWQGLQMRSMQKDFSWENSAKKYLNLYLSLIASSRGKKSKKETP
jgi:starch synthase